MKVERIYPVPNQGSFVRLMLRILIFLFIYLLGISFFLVGSQIPSEADLQPDVNWTAVNQSGAENIGTMIVTAQLSVASGLDVTVPFSVSGTATDSDDYTITASPIIIPAGLLSANITITVADDGIDENEETIIITMGAPTTANQGAIDIHTATITDNDAPPEVNWTSVNQSGAENIGTMTVIAQLSAASGLDVTIPFSVSGTATDSDDYTITAIPIVIPAGLLSSNKTITVVDDGIDENDETVIITMDVPINATQGATNVHTATIMDNDTQPEVNWTTENQSRAENIGTMTVTAQLSAASGLDVTIPFSVSGTATDSDDYTITAAPIVIPAGLLSSNKTITVVDDGIYEYDETVIVTMDVPTNATQGATDVHMATIMDNDTQPEVNWTTVNQSRAEDIVTMTVTAQLSAASGLDVTVPFSVSGTATDPNDYTITVSPITIPAGSLSVNITITVLDDGMDEGLETIIVTMGALANAIQGATDVHTATITDNDAPPELNWTAANQSGSEGAGTMTVTAQLSAVSGLFVIIPFNVSGTATLTDDYTTTANPAFIPPGSLSTNITITVVDDGIDENDETVIVNMDSLINATQGAINVHTATITDNDAQPEVNWTAANQRRAEDIGIITVTARLSAVSGLDVTVPFNVSGTANDPNDYTRTPDPIVIPAGSLSSDITITVVNDGIAEGDETVIVTMDPPINAIQGATSVHTVTINDNITQPEVNWTVANQSGAEGVGTMTITAQLSIAIGSDVIIPFVVSGTASDPNDYTISASPITIPAWDTLSDITITVMDDGIYEDDETVIVTMGAPTNAKQGATDVHTATITENDAQPEVSWTVANQSGAEGVGTMTITAQLSAVSELDVIVPYNVSGAPVNPNNYTITMSPITIPAGLLSSNITITVVDDSIDEGDEFVLVTMGDPNNAEMGDPNRHMVTIIDNDPPPEVSWTAGSQSGAEGVGTMTVRAQLSAASKQNVIVPFSISGTATDLDDYTRTASPIVILAGMLSANITITVMDDAIDEGNETVIVIMGAPINATQGAINSHTATITDNDTQPEVNWTAASQSEAEAGTMTVTAQLSAVSGLDVTVPFSVSGTGTDPDDYTITASPIIIPAGSVSANITINVVEDLIDENDETVIVSIGTPTNATQGANDVHTATCIDNDTQPEVNWAAASQTRAENIGMITVTAQLSTASGLDVTVPFSVSGTAIDPDDYTITASPLFIPAGSLSTNLTITIVDDAINEDDESIIITMGAPINASQGPTDEHTVNINNNNGQPEVSWSVATQKRAEHIGIVTVTAQLSIASGLDVTVPYNISGTATATDDYTITASPLVIPVGSLSTNLTITIVDDAIDEDDEDIIITMGAPINAAQGATYVHTVIINDNDVEPEVNWTVVNQSGTESIGPITVTAQLSAVSGLDVTVPYNISGTATDPDDYTVTASPVTIPAGSVSGNIIITVVEDLFDENDETVIVTMGAPTNATQGTNDVHTAIITDNDPTPEVNWTTVNQSAEENIGTMTVTAQLSSVSGLDVTVPFSVSGTATDPDDYTITASPITIPAGSASSDITITVLDNSINENNETVIINMGVPTNATQGAINIHTATITDDDIAGVTITESDGSTDVEEGGATDTYDVVLDNMPAADVAITLTPDMQTTVDPVSLIFTPANWNVAQQINVTAVDDAVEEGPHTSAITHIAVSSDPNYNGAPFNGSASPYLFMVNITDNDTVNPLNSTITVAPPIVVADGTTFSTITVTLRDGSGLPVSGKTIILSSDRGGLDNITQPAGPTDVNGIAVGSIRSNSIGFATITATDTTDGIVISVQPRVLFAQNAALEITKTGSKDNVVIGDIVTYRIEIRNTLSSDAVQVRIDDFIPPNFKYLKGSAKLNGIQMPDPNGIQRLTFDLGTVSALGDSNGNGYADPGESGYLTLDYKLIVGSGAKPGDYRNMAVAKDMYDSYFISNQTEALITVTLDPVFDLGTIIGKVFEDRNLDGIQGADEPGIKEMMVVLDDGSYVLTDDHGRYHFPAVKPGHRMLKINLHNPWEGAMVTPGESRVVWVTPGILAKVNFGVFLFKAKESIGKNAEYGIKLTKEINTNSLILLGSVETLTLSINGEMLDLPKCDVRMGLKKIEEVVEIKGYQIDESVAFRVYVDRPENVKRWRLKILNDENNVIRKIAGKAIPSEAVFWDGRSEEGDMVEGGKIYQYQMEVEYLDGSLATSPRRLFSVRQTGALSIILTGGAFKVDSAKLSPEAREALKRIAEILRKYPDEKIYIEGYTDSLGTDPYNLKLSKKRAEAALSYLIKQKGIAKSRVKIRFYGELSPVACNDNPEGRELNRRIEIKSSIKEVKEAKILNQYRTNPMAMVDKSALKLHPYGRFQTELKKEYGEDIEVEMRNTQGRSIRTKIFIPRLDILKPEGEVKLVYGSIKDWDRVNHPPDTGQWGKDDKVMAYRIIGQTDPENIVELEGKPVEVEPDGNFSVYVDLTLGKNIFGLMIKNPSGYTRLANLILTVKDKDQGGRPIIVADLVPRLTVHLPPKGSNLTSSNLTISGITAPVNQVQVNDKPVTLEPDGSFNYTVQLPNEKSLLTVKVKDPNGHTGLIEREVEVKKHPLFFLAFADGKVGMLKGRGHLSGAGMDKKTEFFTEGRIAYYLKGVIAGKYLVKSAFDTGTNKFEKLFEDLDETETERLLRNLDPDKFYPVYGDKGTVIYDTESQGKFYLAVESDDLHVLVGNYPLQYTDTELAAYQRTLFGAQLLYKSVSRTKYGQPDTLIAMFGAEARHMHVRNHLRATGGSIYFLSHQHVIEGSEQVMLELRDKNTGLILARVSQQQNVDYTIKYEDGRILFNRPISSVLEDERVVDHALLSGNPVYIQVDYEVRLDTLEKTAYGSRVRKQLGDHMGIGMTYVKDELELGDYKLKGVDTEVRLGKNTRIVGEYAESSGTDSLTLVSEDGGLAYAEGTPNILQEGKAWKIGADMDVGEWFGAPDRIQIGGYLKRLEPGFLSSGNFFEAGTKKFGGKMKLQITQKDKILARYDREEFDNVGLTETGQSDIGTLQWHHEQERWSLAGEYQIHEAKDGGGGSIESTSFAGGRFRFNPFDRLTTELEHQQTITGRQNNQTTLSTEYQANSLLSLKASGTTGSLGKSLQGGTVLTLDRGRLYLNERLSDNQNGLATSTILGAERAIGPESKIYSEYQWERSDCGDRALSVMGAQWQKDLPKGFTLLLGGEYAEIDSDPQASGRHTIAAGLTFAHPSGIKTSTRDEIRKEYGDKKRTQYLTSNRLELKLNPDFTFLGKYRYSKTRDETTGQTEARFEERSIGIAYRPVKHDRFNALARYTQLSDQYPQTIGETEAFETKRDVASLEWSWDLNRYLEWVTKEAAKLKREKATDGASVKTHTYLLIQRLNVHLWRQIDFGTEYRILLQKESDDQRQGWLTEFTWEAVKHLRLGVGFNFTDFSDNEFSDNNYSVYGWFFRIQGKY